MIKIASLACLAMVTIFVTQPVIAKTETKDMATTFKGSKKFSYLTDSLKRIGKMKTLHGAGPFTFFVPKNSAFDHMAYGQWTELWNNKPLLNKVLSRGLVQGRYDSAAISDGTTLHTIDGGTLKIEKRDKDLFVGDAKLNDTDIECSNGVIHILDGFIGKQADPKAK